MQSPSRFRPTFHPLEERIVPAMDPFLEPTIIPSVNGVLTATLVQSVGTATVGDTVVTNAWTYNGQYAAPTLWAQPGDLLDITIVNLLNEQTNLHTHGLHVSPLGNSDNVLLQINPTENNHYQIQIPADHPEGLYWYHPHRHGTVNNQIALGLSGILVIGRPDGGFPELNGLPQRQLLIKNALLSGNTIVNPQENGPNFDPSLQTFTVNGQLNPVITMQPNQWQVLNMVNAGNNSFYGIRLIDDMGMPRPMLAVAEDGNPFTAVQQQGSLGLPPGRRWSFTFQPPAMPATWRLVSFGFNDGTHQWPGSAMNPLVLMTLDFQGTPVAPTMPVMNGSALTPPNNYYHDLRTLTNAQIAAFRTVQFDETGGVEFINGGAFPNNPVFQPRLNTVEEWTLINPTANDHPFHLHVNPQQVVLNQFEMGPVTPMTGLGQWQDVVNVPAGRSVTIRIEFVDFLGSMVYHCHRVDHEDHGMMALVNMIPETPILVVGPDSGHAPTIKVYNALDNSFIKEFDAFDSGFLGGVRVAVGDVNFDGVSDIVCGAGPGAQPTVRVFDGANGNLLYSFFAFTESFAGGVYVAAGDINSDGYDDMIVSSGPGMASHVHVFSGKDGSLLASVNPYDSGFLGGATVTSGDINFDGRFDVVTGAGPGAGPHVKAFSPGASDGESHGTHGALPVSLHEFLSFLAFDAGFQGGVYVATGMVNTNGLTEIIVGAGAGAGPNVRAFLSDDATSSHTSSGHASGSTTHTATGTVTLIASFFAYDPSFLGGARVGRVHTIDDDNYLVGPGSGATSHIRTIESVTFNDLSDFFAYEQSFTGGVFVAGS